SGPGGFRGRVTTADMGILLLSGLTYLRKRPGGGVPSPLAESTRGTRPRRPRGGLRLAFAAGMVVVEDRADAVPDGDQRVAAPAAQVDEEALVRLRPAVADHVDRDGRGGLAGGEGQRARRGGVIVVGDGGAAVAGGEADRHRRVVGGRQADREDEGGLAL